MTRKPTIRPFGNTYLPGNTNKPFSHSESLNFARTSLWMISSFQSDFSLVPNWITHPSEGFGPPRDPAVSDEKSTENN
jgi:hypothetical protein